jgi:3-deoxy-manno-octulosonate cytidylyltransferase (CMP-KDO synthetase)
MRTIVIIPARLQSARLPRKMLVDVAGKTMLERTHEVASAADCGRVLVLTDSDEVVQDVRAFGGEAMLTDPELQSGTARIASVVDELDADVIVNLQGDAPLTDPSVVSRSAEEAAQSGAPITMPVYRIERIQDVHDPSVVKVIRAHDGRTLYCSRSAVPHVRDTYELDWTEAATFWGHVGIYAYSRDFLRSFDSLPSSPLEDTERLEQLRWLEAGLRLHTFEVDPQGPSVDTPADLDRVREAFAAMEEA